MSDGVVRVENLTRRFGELTAVDQVNFSVAEGEVFGLLGPNGAGKSTLIRMLCTLRRPTGGTAVILGHDILREPDEVRRCIGLVAEKLILYERLTAEENLRLFGRLNHLPGDVISSRIDYLLKLLRMEEWRKHLAGTFSSGMKQRINIARALLHKPAVLFLDEPTLGLDPQTTRSLHEIIRGLRRDGMSVILTTHIMSEAEMLSDHIAIIDHGRIIASNTPEGLKRASSKEDAHILDINLASRDESLVKTLANLEGVISLGYGENSHLKIHLSGNGAVKRVIETVYRSGALIKDISTAAPTLEDIFLELTGHEMRGEATEKVPSMKVDHRARHAAKRVR